MTDTRVMPPAATGEDIVYVREVKAEELPKEMRQGPLPARLYAIHDASGARLAVTDDRRLAFRIARQNDRTPVSAH